MNERHAIIENVGGKAVIASWEPSPFDLIKLVVVFQNKESFLLRYSNRYVTIDVPDGRAGGQQRHVPLGAWWLNHRNRRQYRGVTFLPGGPKEANQCLNLWQGWGIEAKPGDWSPIREHIEAVLAGGNESLLTTSSAGSHGQFKILRHKLKWR
jgi:Mesyanzhinovviridae DNA primase